MLITENEILYSEVKALTWKQPFASMMQYGKQETRSRRSNYKGLVLICSGLQPYTEAQMADISGGFLYRKIKDTLRNKDDHQPLGHAIAIGRQTGCLNMETYMYTLKNWNPIDAKILAEAKTLVKYYGDLFVYTYEDVVKINPFPWSGSQGWTTLNFEQKQKIKLLNPPKI